jgi:hypothetical protein
MDAHNVQIGPNGEIVCTNCGLREGFQDGCKFSIEKTKIEVENKRIEVENMKVIVGAVLSSLGYLILFLFVAVVYLGLDGLKMQISRVVDECSKGAISHLFRRR